MNPYLHSPQTLIEITTLARQVEDCETTQLPESSILFLKNKCLKKKSK